MIPKPDDFDPNKLPFNETNFPKGSYFMWCYPDQIYKVIGDWGGGRVRIRNITLQRDYTFDETYVSDHKRLKQMQTKELTRDDFEIDPVGFTPSNFKKGDYFWYISGVNQVLADWANESVLVKDWEGVSRHFLKDEFTSYRPLKKTAKPILLTKDDFEPEGIYFTKDNFPKGTKFWRNYDDGHCEVVGNWNELNQVEVLNPDGMTVIFVESQTPLYHLMKKDKTMTLNHEEIKKAIESLPGVCKEGKEGVAKILKEFGYVAPVEKVVLEPGYIYVRKHELAEDGRNLAMFYIVPGDKTDMKYICFHWMGREGASSISFLRNESLVLYAKSFKEAFTRLKDEGRKISHG